MLDRFAAAFEVAALRSTGRPYEDLADDDANQVQQEVVRKLSDAELASLSALSESRKQEGERDGDPASRPYSES